jgi:hypothetical protein
MERAWLRLLIGNRATPGCALLLNERQGRTTEKRQREFQWITINRLVLIEPVYKRTHALLAA